jgi:hypothetical protein
MDRKAYMVGNSKESMVLGYGGLPFNQERRIFIKHPDKGATRVPF